MFINVQTSRSTIRHMLVDVRAFVFERDQHQMECAELLRDISWPDQIDVAWMQAEQRALDEEERRNDEEVERYYEDVQRDVEAEEAEEAWLDMAQDDEQDIDIDVCQCCGRFYGPHAKEKEWSPFHASDILPQRCFRCWGV